MPALERLRERYVRELRDCGVLTDRALARAFRRVPREVFVAGGFQRGDGGWAAPDDSDFLETVYRNTVLVTKLRDGAPVSSSSQPSLMATMLGTLAVTPGMRVLEIGAGTGYNAALLTALGATVTAVDVQEDVVRAAVAALDRADVTGVRVVLGDGWSGEPSGAPYDRLIVTVGIAGLSSAWPEQLAPGAHVVAPIAHGGLHPVMSVRADRDAMWARPECAAGFMTAAGPLAARHPAAHPPPSRGPAVGPDTADVVLPPVWPGELTFTAYHDLWFAAAVRDRRVTSMPVATPELLGACGLVDGPNLAALLPDGRICAAGPDAGPLAGALAALVEDWLVAGRPPLTAWTGRLALTGDPERPIWAPTSWELAPPE